MRTLTEEEANVIFSKLYKFIENNANLTIIDGKKKYLRFHNNRIFLISEPLMKKISNIGNDQMIGLGQCIGKFTHSNKFHLTIGALDILAKKAKYKVWIKPGSEMSFLYGNNLLKSGLGRITENTPKNGSVVVYNMADVPLGFGITARSTNECKSAVTTDIVVLNQADIGEYLRHEETLI